ncbi:MAG TPA: hypothetical protein VJL88_08865 [Nitrospira sp.]|nr:hypothetical protein [Nitrospira sp.]
MLTLRTSMAAPFLVIAFLLTSQRAFGADVSCQFKAPGDTTEIHVLANGTTLWAGPIEKQQTKAVSVPEGPFTVISKIYNENLKRKEDVRAEMHTRQCRNNAPFTVPLFPEPTNR